MGLGIVVLAAQRDGKLDPLAEAAGVSHKCLVPIGGRPLLAHVLAALAATDGIGEVRIVVEPGAEARLKQIAVASGLLASFVPASSNIADSVYAAWARLSPEGPQRIAYGGRLAASTGNYALALARADSLGRSPDPTWQPPVVALECLPWPSMSPVDRRTFLKGAAAAAGATALTGPAFSTALAVEPAAVVQYGVASGDPLSDRVMIWTRGTVASQ